MEKLIKCVIFVALIPFLQSCTALVVVGALGAGVTGMVIYDKRDLQIQMSDKRMEHRIAKEINNDLELKENTNISVAVYDGLVLLTGQAPNEELKQMALQLAKRVPMIKSIHNEIQIKGVDAYLSRISDSWVKTKLRTVFLTAEDLKSGSFKIVCENGIVYLMGTVTYQEGEKAADIASQVKGVQRVVKLFSYTDRNKNRVRG